MTSLWLAPLLALAVCLLVLAGLMARAHRLPQDHPNERSLHQRPVPRVGGVGLAAGLGAALAVAGTGDLAALWLAAGLLALMSWFDDLRGLPVALRLSAHVLAAGLLTLEMGLDGGTLVLVCLLLVWSTNLYNFMDGTDGLAGGMALIGFSVLAWAAHLHGDVGLARACLAVALSALGFLAFNFPPARLFLGDSGAIPLGFLAAGLGLAGWREGAWPAAFPLLVFSPFLVDASLTLLRRGLAGERLWRAHRDHYYQRLVRLGWSHRRLALAAYALMAAAGASALALLVVPQVDAWLLGAWAGLYLALALVIERRWRRSEA